jgi:hypothetical protein
MRRLLWIIGLLFAALPAKANDVYISQSGGALSTPCNSTNSAAWFNNINNWGTNAGQIGSGTTVHICGTITSALAVPKSVGTGTITIFFEPHDAQNQRPNGAISLTTISSPLSIKNSTNSWIVNGSTPCGPSPTGQQACTGQLQVVGNGSAGPLHSGSANIRGIDFTGSTGSLEVKNLELGPLYIHNPPANITQSSILNNVATVVCDVAACGLTVGITKVAILSTFTNTSQQGTTGTGASLELDNSGQCGMSGVCYTVSTVSGNQITFSTSGLADNSTGAGGVIAEQEVVQQNSNNFYANPMAGNVHIHDCRIHDSGWQLNPSGNVSNAVTYEINNNELYNQDHALQFASANAFTALIHDNHIHGFINWDGTSRSTLQGGGGGSAFAHHDGIQWSTTPNGTQPPGSYYIYNNLWDGDPGASTTGVIFAQTSPNNLYVFNELYLVPDGVHTWGNGFLKPSNGNGVHVYNNTVYGGASPNGEACVLSDLNPAYTSSNNDFINNVMTNCNTLVNFTGAVMNANTATAGIHHNIYTGSSRVNGNSIFRWNGANVNTLATWQADSGDATDQFSTGLVGAGLDHGTGAVQAGSIVIGNGANLTTLCSGHLVPLCSDTSAGNTRVPAARNASRAWDAGASQFAPSHQISKVQVINPASVHGTSLSASLPTETAGHFLIAGTAYQLPGTTVTLTDTAGNTWVHLTAYNNSNCGTTDGNYSGVQLWYAENIKGGANTVTMQVNATTYIWLAVVEYSGIKTSGSLAASNGFVATTSSTSISAGTLNATGPNNLVFGFFHNEHQNTNMTAGSGYVDEANSGLTAMIEDNVAAAAGNYNPSANYTNGSDSCGVATDAAFISQ